jgi:tetratricopeptide (TPR) repeat protein
MTDASNDNHGALLLQSAGALTPAGAPNPLVARGLADLKQASPLKPNTAVFYYQRALRRLEARIEDAGPDFLLLLEKGIDEAIDDVDEAIQRLNKTVNKNPNEAANYLHRGASHLLKNRILVNRIELCCDHDDYDSLAWLADDAEKPADFNFEQGTKDLAQAIALDALSAAPYEPWPYLDRAGTYNEGQFASICVAAYVIRAEASPDSSALHDFTEALRFDPGNTLLLRRRAYLWGRKGDYKNAIRDMDEAIRLRPNDISFYQLRACIRTSGPDEVRDYDGAIDDLNAAIRLDQNNLCLFSHRARFWASKKNYDMAIEDYTHAIELDPTSPTFYSQRASLWAAKKDYERAIQDSTEAIRLDPSSGHRYHSRAKLWLQLEDFAAAAKDFATHVSFHPDTAYPYLDLALLLATCPDDKVRDGQRAIGLAKKACELSKNLKGGTDAFFLDALAAAHAEAGEFEEAVRCQQMALEHYAEWPKQRFEQQHKDLRQHLLRQRLELYRQRKPARLSGRDWKLW